MATLDAAVESPPKPWKDRGCAALSVAMGMFVPAAADAATGSQAFTTPGEHVFVVPPGVNSVTVMLVGSNGGAGAHGTPGGAGATETATIAVIPGEKLYAEVGGDGGDGDPAGQDTGGFNGGGDGGVQFVILTGAPSGGGGGGASDVRLVRPVCRPHPAAAPLSRSPHASWLLPVVVAVAAVSRPPTPPEGSRRLERRDGQDGTERRPEQQAWLRRPTRDNDGRRSGGRPWGNRLRGHQRHARRGRRWRRQRRWRWWRRRVRRWGGDAGSAQLPDFSPQRATFSITR